MFWNFTVWINCSSELKIFANSWLSASNFKSLTRSLKQFFLTVDQNNFGNKIWFHLVNSKLILHNQSLLTYSNPLVFDDIVNAESLMGISFQHSSKGPFIHYVSTCREGSGLVQKMAIFAYCQYIDHANKYLVSGWVKKCPKTCLRHIWMVPNEIFCIFGHIFPFWVGKLILTGPNALFHSGGNGQTVVTVEWRETT